MKTLKPLFYGLLIVLMCCNYSYGQDQIKATLKCNVTALKAGNPAYQVCQFEGQERGTDTRNYTINAEVDDTITWNGESSDGSSAINIKKIKYNKGTNVFSKKELEGETTVVGQIKEKTNGKPYKYKISFKIDNTRKKYTIDPKIIVGGQ